MNFKELQLSVKVEGISERAWFKIRRRGGREYVYLEWGSGARVKRTCVYIGVRKMHPKQRAAGKKKKSVSDGAGGARGSGSRAQDRVQKKVRYSMKVIE